MIPIHIHGIVDMKLYTIKSLIYGYFFARSILSFYSVWTKQYTFGTFEHGIKLRLIE